jgi:hypothetical protein
MEPHQRTGKPADSNEPEGLEDWLQDLRTEAPSDPFARAEPAGSDEVQGGGRQGGGRHRAAD